MTAPSHDPQQTVEGVDPADLELALRVIASVHDLPADQPDFLAVRRATSSMFKAVKLNRRREGREAVASADRAVIAATATGAPDRIDDETRGIPLSTSATAPSAGTLLRSTRFTTSSARAARPSATASATLAPTCRVSVRC